MNKIEQKHLEAIEKEYKSDSPTQDFLDDSATSCAEITKEYAEKFDLWKAQKRWSWVNREQMYGCDYIDNDEFLTFKELWDLFINDLNEKT